VGSGRKGIVGGREWVKVCILGQPWEEELGGGVNCEKVVDQKLSRRSKLGESSAVREGQLLKGRTRSAVK